MQIPSGGRVAFGSPAWGTLNTWQVRWRFASGLTATWYLHYTDANDYLAATITGSQIALAQVVSGTTYTLGTANVNLTNGMQYWLQVTQFPCFGQPPLVQATVLADGGDVPGNTIGQAGPVPAHDAVTALSGQPQIAASGAVLGISSHALKLFGPGGWTLLSSGTGAAAGAWEQNAANTYPNGPVASYAAARIDAAPAGTLNAQWQAGDVSSAARVQQTACPVAAAGDVLGVAVWLRSTGVGAGCTQSAQIWEYDATLPYPKRIFLHQSREPSLLPLSFYYAGHLSCTP